MFRPAAPPPVDWMLAQREFVTLAVSVHNQKNELVLTGEQKYLLRKRNA